VVLFPLTFALHIAEEYWGGPGFPVYASRLSGFHLSEGAFLLANAVFWLLMSGAVAAALYRQSAWLIVGLGVVVLINGTLHLAGTILGSAYSPGLFSGVLIWGPLGLFTVLRARRHLDRGTFRAGVVAGIVAHALVPVVALTLARVLDG
jgi:hypothetical protein